jgi:hypothetical protein
MSLNRFLRCSIAALALCQLPSCAVGAKYDAAPSGVSTGDVQSDIQALSTSYGNALEDGQIRRLIRWLVLVAVCASLVYAWFSRLQVLPWPDSSSKWAPMAIASTGSKTQAWGLELESLLASAASAMPARIRRMWPHSIKYTSLKSAGHDDDDSCGYLVKPHSNEATSPSRRFAHSDVELSGFDCEAQTRSDADALDDALGSFLASKLYAKRSNIDSLL